MRKYSVLLLSEKRTNRIVGFVVVVVVAVVIGVVVVVVVVVVVERVYTTRWTKRCTEWQPRRGKRSKRRPSRRWKDDKTRKEGTTWNRKATDRGLWKALMEGSIL